MDPELICERLKQFANRRASVDLELDRIMRVKCLAHNQMPENEQMCRPLRKNLRHISKQMRLGQS